MIEKRFVLVAKSESLERPVILAPPALYNVFTSKDRPVLAIWRGEHRYDFAHPIEVRDKMNDLQDPVGNGVEQDDVVRNSISSASHQQDNVLLQPSLTEGTDRERDNHPEQQKGVVESPIPVLPVRPRSPFIKTEVGASPSIGPRTSSNSTPWTTSLSGPLGVLYGSQGRDKAREHQSGLPETDVTTTQGDSTDDDSEKLFEYFDLSQASVETEHSPRGPPEDVAFLFLSSTDDILSEQPFRQCNTVDKLFEQARATGVLPNDERMSDTVLTVQISTQTHCDFVF